MMTTNQRMYHGTPEGTKILRNLKPFRQTPIADLKNTGERYGGALTAGLFLKQFAKDTPWVHVDIAGPASTNRDSGASQKGATGYAVASIVQLVTAG